MTQFDDLRPELGGEGTAQAVRLLPLDAVVGAGVAGTTPSGSATVSAVGAEVTTGVPEGDATTR